MISDDERREVARRLRGGYDVVSDSHGRFWLNGTLFGMDITARSEEQIRDGLARLADLIEPPRQCPCYDSGRHWCSIHDVPIIDREALLALADEMERRADLPSLTVAGQDLVFSDFLVGYARRVRKACGEGA